MNRDKIKKQLEDFRNDLLLEIHNTVVKAYGFIGTFYRNIGTTYINSNIKDKYEKSPLVILNDDSPIAFRGFEAVKVYELFLDPQTRELKIATKTENGYNFNEPIKKVQTEGLINILNWLIEHNFIKEEKEIPYRCKECGSLNIQEKAWVDSNTHEHKDTITDSNSDLWCEECCAHTDQVDETELIALIKDYWWEEQAGHEKLKLLIDLFSEEEDTSPEACDQKWEELPVEQKIELWNKYKED